mgnify:CR=1 FL=1
MGRHVNAQAVKSKARHIGNAAGGEHDVVCTEARAVIHGDGDPGVRDGSGRFDDYDYGRLRHWVLDNLLRPVVARR